MAKLNNDYTEDDNTRHILTTITLLVIASLLMNLITLPFLSLHPSPSHPPLPHLTHPSPISPIPPSLHSPLYPFHNTTELMSGAGDVDQAL